MPMRLEDYPADWKAIAAFIREANGYVCQECDRQCTKPGEPYSGGRDVLTVAHFDQDYTGAQIFVAALCAGCHLRHDARQRQLLRFRQEWRRKYRAGQMQMELQMKLLENQ